MRKWVQNLKLLETEDQSQNHKMGKIKMKMKIDKKKSELPIEGVGRMQRRLCVPSLGSRRDRER